MNSKQSRTQQETTHLFFLRNHGNSQIVMTEKLWRAMTSYVLKGYGIKKLEKWMCVYCNGYGHEKENQQVEFKLQFCCVQFCTNTFGKLN